MGTNMVSFDFRKGNAQKSPDNMNIESARFKSRERTLLLVAPDEVDAL